MLRCRAGPAGTFCTLIGDRLRVMGWYRRRSTRRLSSRMPADAAAICRATDRKGIQPAMVTTPANKSLAPASPWSRRALPKRRRCAIRNRRRRRGADGPPSRQLGRAQTQVVLPQSSRESGLACSAGNAFALWIVGAPFTCTAAALDHGFLTFDALRSSTYC